MIDEYIAFFIAKFGDKTLRLSDMFNENRGLYAQQWGEIANRRLLTLTVPVDLHYVNYDWLIDNDFIMCEWKMLEHLKYFCDSCLHSTAYNRTKIILVIAFVLFELIMCLNIVTLTNVNRMELSWYIGLISYVYGSSTGSHLIHA